MLIAEAQSNCGTLSNPSKMPGKGTSTPASRCITGSKLRNVKGSVCEGCYAFERGAYAWHNVQQALEFRYSKVMDSKDNPAPWINGMVKLIWNQKYFRWYDSGDLQGTWQLANICEVARLTPHVKHWLPTREYRFVKDYQGIIPANLVVRLSAHMVDGPAPVTVLPTSTVVTSDASCQAYLNNNECGDCRACWSPEVKNVSYLKH